LHPVLRLAPGGLKQSLAGIMRARVTGVRHVAVEWPEGTSANGRDCYLVGGSATQIEDRMHALLETGSPLRPPPEVAGQLRDHAESIRVAENNEDLRLTPVCLLAP
jgi:hypothetical protein